MERYGSSSVRPERRPGASDRESDVASDANGPRVRIEAVDTEAPTGAIVPARTIRRKYPRPASIENEFGGLPHVCDSHAPAIQRTTSTADPGSAPFSEAHVPGAVVGTPEADAPTRFHPGRSDLASAVVTVWPNVIHDPGRVARTKYAAPGSIKKSLGGTPHRWLSHAPAAHRTISTTGPGALVFASAQALDAISGRSGVTLSDNRFQPAPNTSVA